MMARWQCSAAAAGILALLVPSGSAAQSDHAGHDMDYAAPAAEAEHAGHQMDRITPDADAEHAGHDMGHTAPAGQEADSGEIGAAILLGEPITLTTCGFALAVVATVFAGRRMQIKH